MTPRLFAIPLVWCLAIDTCTPAIAQAPSPGETRHGQAGPGRYTMSPVEGGFLRLDTATGEMSLCTGTGADWSCAPLPDSARDLAEENERLKAEKKVLEDDVRRMEDEFVTGRAETDKPLAGPGSEQGGLGVPDLKLPSEQDVDRAVDYLEGMIRKFRDRFEDFGDKTDPNRPDRSSPPERSDPTAPVPRTSDRSTPL